jgi:glycosyltransferase involved in cell wall biosynthesis
LYPFRPYFEQAGHTLEVCPLPGHWWGWLRLKPTLRDTDAVILQRKLPHRWQLALLRRATPRLLFDVDDAVFLRDSYSTKGLHSTSRFQRFAAVARAADAVLAGNAFLAAQASRWSSAERVHLMPTCVDPDLYPLAGHLRYGAGVQLVWVGSSSTLRGLKQIQPLLEGLGERWPGLQLKIICDRFLELHSLPVLACPWSRVSEPSDIAAADIGISWLPDDNWSRGKCGLKVLQYMAAGLPVVANPVGVQAELIRHGETGFLVEGPEQWSEAVGWLSRDPVLRRRMGRAGRRRVEEAFSVGSGATRWLTLLSQLEGTTRMAPAFQYVA